MKRNEAIDLLEKYNEFLYEMEFASSDPTSIDEFLGTKWAKENLPLYEESIYASLYRTGLKTEDDFREKPDDKPPIGKKKNLPLYVGKAGKKRFVKEFMENPEFESKIEDLVKRILDKSI